MPYQRLIATTMLQWTDIVWLALASGCATLGALHLYIALRHRLDRQHLLLAAAFLSVSAFTGIELMMMREVSVESYGALVRWLHLPMFTLTVSMVLCLQLGFRVGRWWLGALACTIRGASLVANFTTGVNLNYTEITALNPLPFGFGANISVATGTVSPWMTLGSISLLLMVVYAVDVAIAAHRQGGEVRRYGAVRLSIAVAFGYFVGGAAYAIALYSGDMAVAVAPVFVGLPLVMSYELGDEVLRGHHLSKRLNAATIDLREGAARLELAHQAVAMGLWEWDFASDRVWLSDAARQIVGIDSSAEWNQAELAAWVHPEDLPALRSAVDRTRGGDGQLSTECRIRARNGGQRWIALRGAATPDGAAPTGMHGVMVDVSALRGADEQLRVVFTGATVGLVMSDAEGRILLANPHLAAVFGYSVDELQQMHIEDLVPHSQRPSHAALRAGYLGAAVARPMQSRREVQGLHKDGTTIPIAVMLSPFQRDTGLVVLAVISDLSERQGHERQIALQREELAHLNRGVVLSELSGSLAHELNQPLTAILSNAQAALRFIDHRPPNLAEVREALVNVVESDRRAGEVIRRLRAMLRKDPPSLIQLDANEVVRDVLRIVRSDLLNRNIVIVEDYAPDLPLVFGDRVQLQQVLLNLMMNASDAMGEVIGDRRMTLRTQRTDDGLEVQIQDVGIGIPAADLERIFEPFVSTKKDGLGLGLAVCRALVEAHGGRLWASNAPASGAILHLRLPAGGSS